MIENGQNVSGLEEFETDANVTKAIVGVVKARDVHLNRAGAGLAIADGNLSIVNGGCGPVIANGGVSIRNGGCGPLLANGDVSIQNGGTQAILAAGGATIGRRAFVGVVASPRVTVEDGAKVLASTPLAFALGVGAGIALTMFSRIFRR